VSSRTMTMRQPKSLMLHSCGIARMRRLSTKYARSPRAQNWRCSARSSHPS
jgi:hypothetical protein